MGHHAIEVLRQGVWASLTGGWFYDPHLTLFSNTFHLYLWLVFLIIPFVLTLTIPKSSLLLAWGIYCGFIIAIFVVIKVVNYKLHMLFDTSEKIAVPGVDSQTGSSWQRGGSHSPTSVERIELDTFHRNNSARMSHQPSPSGDPNTNIATADVELRTDEEVAGDLSSKTPQALDDITSMEDITSLEDLQLDIPKPAIILESAETSPDRVRNFRQTVKAMSTQVTPQTSPLVGYKRRALSQERWPLHMMSSVTPPPTLKRQQPHYHSQRVTRRRNLTYKRRSKSVLDSPHGSHMLVGESRAEEQPPLTLEWAGYPHPSPRPRHRNRQMSLEEPVSGSSGRRYSLDLKPPRRDRVRDRALLRTGSERLEDIKVLRDSLLNKSATRKISTVSEPADPFGESDSSQSIDKTEQVPFSKLTPKSLSASPASQSGGKNSNGALGGECSPGLKSGGETELDAETVGTSGHTLNASSATPPLINKSSNNNVSQESSEASDDSPSTPPDENRNTGAADDPVDSSCGPSPLTVVEEVVELERPRNPTPTAAAAEDDATGGAIPKTGAKYDKYRTRTRRASADDAAAAVADKSPSASSSMSSSEDTALLVARAKAIEQRNGFTRSNERASGLLKRRPAVRRHTTADTRSSIRRARYYGSGSNSSWTSQRSGLGLSRSGSETARSRQNNNRTPSDDKNGWHYFQDDDGCWFKYTFDSTSDGLPVKMGKDFDPWAAQADNSAGGDNSPRPHNSADLLDWHNFFPADHVNDTTYSSRIQRSLRDNIAGNIVSLMRQRSNWSADLERRDSDDSSETTVHIERVVTPTVPSPKQFYKWKLCSSLPSIKIWLDRLSLLALLDRNVSKRENVASVLLVAMVTVLASFLLANRYYQDVYILLFCFVLAGCQYSLVKSVQPDAASPTHGYNNVIVYSRGFYFCLISVAVIGIDYGASTYARTTFTLYNVDIVNATLLAYARELLKGLMLCLPLVFLFGLLPQVNTFLQYFLEQVEIHVFGGNGTTSLLAATYTVAHSLLALLILYGLALVPVELVGRDLEKVDQVATNLTFSLFCALLISLSYHYSRMSSDPTHLWMLLKAKRGHEQAADVETTQTDDSIKDPLPSQIRKSVYQRLRNDLMVCFGLAIFMFGIHVSTVFGPAHQPLVHDIICYFTMATGFVTHYVLAQLRKEYPWLCCAHPLLKTPERSQFNVTGPATITWFEKLYLSLRFVEKNLLYPAVFLSGLSISAPALLTKFGLRAGPLVLVVCGFKCLRSSYSDTASHYCVLALTQLAFGYDFSTSPERDMFVLNYAFMLLFYSKFVDFYLKCKFIFVYIAPWQLAWGSAFHAFAQPLSVPHACMLFMQAAFSALFYTPLNPFLGSAVFINSYMRPIKFWERDYNTKRVDHSNIRLASQVDSNVGTDDNNLNSIFYEHLTRSLQTSLCGDLMMGRWGEAHQGDMFIMASDYLNALVHIVEMGNGLVTFQLRGLEFRGTYCQQREVEAITEGVDDDLGFCCCSPGHLPHMLSVNAAFGERWLAWEVTMSTYILNGYSITDNNAAGMLQVYDLRKILITYYVKSVIFYTIRSAKLPDWIRPDGITADIDTNEELGGVFSIDLDEDFDRMSQKVTQRQFSRVYLNWIHYCLSKCSGQVKSEMNYEAESRLIRLCYALSLVARRALSTASHNNCTSVNVEFFLHGLHALFKGDFRITGRDEWIFNDMELLRKVISPAIRMAVKLHQDHFSIAEEYSNNSVLYSTMVTHIRELVITHEADPDWRNAVLANRPSLLALRHVFDEGSNVYKIIMLNKRHLSFRIIKVNRECVRGLWAGQQQELIFLRNRNPERGSIQNAKQALRNMINSSCDQPIGYPIYVSPLTTSYSGTNSQLTSALFPLGEISLRRVTLCFTSLWNNLMDLPCALACRYLRPGRHGNRRRSYAPNRSQTTRAGGDAPTSDSFPPSNSSLRTIEARSSLRTSTRQPPATKPSSSSLPLGLVGNFSRPNSVTKDQLGASTNTPAQHETSFSEPASTFAIGCKVKIIDLSCVMSSINTNRRPDPIWPSADMQKSGGTSGWRGWSPKEGTQGVVAHRWMPCHSDVKCRSNIDKTIYLVKVEQNYVPVTEPGLACADPD